jgi:hypothetical protein
MSSTVFFISTLVVISVVYYFILKIFFDKNKSRFERWFNFLLINAIAVTVNYYAFKGLSEIDKTEYSIGYPIGITVLMFFIRGIYEFIFTPSNSFTSTEEKSSENKVFPAREYKKVAESDADKIAIYPRITIRDIELESDWRNPKHIIFDSSDFIVINKTFGTFEGLQESFSQGKEFKFKDEKLYAEKVQVDFMSIYDDYSGGLINKHTDAYEGKNTPYHFQIIVWAKRIKK